MPEAKTYCPSYTENGDFLGFTPPLSITSAEMDEIVQCTLTALNSVADQLTKEYLWNG